MSQANSQRTAARHTPTHPKGIPRNCQFSTKPFKTPWSVTPRFWAVVLPMLFALIAARNRQARYLQRRDCPVHLKRVNENFLNASVPALEQAKGKLNRRFKFIGAPGRAAKCDDRPRPDCRCANRIHTNQRR